MQHPFLMMMPPWFQQQQQQPQQQSMPDGLIPARVNKALEFIALLSQKTMARAAVNDVAIEHIEGQKLSDEEGTALATACNMLTDYFGGRLKPDTWEELRVMAARVQIEHDTNGVGRVTDCFACAPGPPSHRCVLCHGSGHLLVFGAGPPQEVTTAEQPPSGQQSSDDNHIEVP